MKVAVTGGTGFVGCHTVAALQQAGDHVRLLVRSPDQDGAGSRAATSASTRSCTCPASPR